ncbi:MAG: cupredoxin domain-containing protein [Spirochaetaceae bacterium]|nr:MAG: cupredoxin domain-containing protein [Spirochaetaceae bacterium]
MLHKDAGTVRVYEFPGPDVPIRIGENIVMSSFQVSEPQTVRIQVKARKFEFIPDVIQVKAGTPVEPSIVSEDTAHGIACRGLGINERLEKGKETVIRFTPTNAGRYVFSCSVYCGSDHRSMGGELIVN